MDAWFNTWATVPATITAAFALFTALLYGLGSPWWKSLLGVVFFGLFIGSVPVFALVLVRRVAAIVISGGPSTTGDGFGAFAFTVYCVTAIAWVAVFITIIRERRNSRTATPPMR